MGGAKARLRAAVIAARRAMSGPERAAAASSVTAALLSLPQARSARTVALYVSLGTEPATDELLGAFRSGDVRVLLPVVRDDLDLDWAIYAGVEHLSPAARGTRAPDGELLGVDAVSGADLVVVPALAVGPDGSRLGRGGGSYDRALRRVPPGRAVVALLYDGELLPSVPSEPHDRPVTLAVTPSGVHRPDPSP